MLSLILISLMALIPLDMNPIELFVAQYGSHYLKEKVPEFHRDWYRALNDKEIERLVIESGRGSAKSTIASVLYPLFEICEGDYDEIQTFSQSGGNTGLSTKWMKKISHELLHNQVLIADYGIRRGGLWGQDHIEVKRGDGKVIDVYCRGKHSAARGSRGLVIIDDPQDAKDCRSETVLAADEDWLFSDVLPILLKGQRLVFIGTPVSKLALIEKCKRLPNWKVLSFPAEHGGILGGGTIWPEQWPDEVLAERLSEIGLTRYNAEYLCKPSVPGNPVFQDEWLKSYDPECTQFQRLKNGGLYVVTGMDTAESKASNADYTAIITVGATYDPKPICHVLEVKRRRLTTKEGVEQLFITFDKFQQHKSVVESRCAPPNKDAVIEEIEDRQRIYGKYVNLYQTKPNKDKVTRAHAVQSMFQEGRVLFDTTDPEQVGLIDELTMFTGDQNFHDDRVDALVMALTDIKQFALTQANKGTMQSAVGAGW